MICWKKDIRRLAYVTYIAYTRTVCLFVNIYCLFLVAWDLRMDAEWSGLNIKKGSPNICPQCGNAYQRASSLKRHLKYECQKDPQHTCPICNKKTHLKSNLLQHMRLRHNITSYSSLL